MLATEIFLAEKAAINNLYVEELLTKQGKSNQISIFDNQINVNNSAGKPVLYMHGGTLSANNSGGNISMSATSVSGSGNSGNSPNSGVATRNIVQSFTLSSDALVVFPSFTINISTSLTESTDVSGGSTSVTMVEFVNLIAVVKLDGQTIFSAYGQSRVCPSFTKALAQGSHSLTIEYHWSYNINGSGSCTYSASTPGSISAAIMTSENTTEVAGNGIRSMWGSNKKFEVKSVGNTFNILLQNGNTAMTIENEGAKINNEFVPASPTIKRIEIVQSYPGTQDPNTLYIKTN